LKILLPFCVFTLCICKTFFQDVSGDYELQAWAHDLAHECLGWQDGDTKGMPDKISSVNQLVSGCSEKGFDFTRLTIENKSTATISNKMLTEMTLQKRARTCTQT